MPDPSIGVSDLMSPLEHFMKVHKCRNLAVLLNRPVGITWKTSPCCTWLAYLGELMLGYVKVSPTLCLSSKKNKAAVEKLNSLEKVNWTKKTDEDFYDWFDDSIRLACKQLRDLKADAVTKDRCYKKCSEKEIASIQAVLELMHAKDEKFPAIPPSWSGDGSVASFVGQSTATSSGVLPLRDLPGQPQTNLSIFKKVLERKVSDASSAASPQQVSSQASNPFVTHGGMYSKDDVSLLEDVLKLNNATAEHEAKKSSKKSKQLPSAASSSHAKKAPMKKKSYKGKPAGIKKTVAPKIPKFAVVKKRCRAKTTPEPVLQEVQPPSALGADGEAGTSAIVPAKDVDVKTLRKRATSKAYHNALKLAVGEGKNAEEAKACAQLAYAAEAKKWDEGEDIE